MGTIVECPGIPFLMTLPEGMHVGCRIRIVGSVKMEAKNFYIDFQCGPNVDPTDSVAFQLAFLFKENCLERNHYESHSKTWGFREHSGALPLRPGDGFVIHVRCEESSFTVDINGTKFCEFSHRLMIEAITHMYVQGDVDIDSIELLS